MTRRGPKIPRAGYKRAGRRASKRLLALGARLQAPLGVRLDPRFQHPPPDDDLCDAPKLGAEAVGGHSEGTRSRSDRPGGAESQGWAPDQVRGDGVDGERARLRAEIAELEKAQGAAPGWGAAVGAREERLRNLRVRLLELGEPL